MPTSGHPTTCSTLICLPCQGLYSKLWLHCQPEIQEACLGLHCVLESHKTEQNSWFYVILAIIAKFGLVTMWKIIFPLSPPHCLTILNFIVPILSGDTWPRAEEINILVNLSPNRQCLTINLSIMCQTLRL